VIVVRLLHPNQSNPIQTWTFHDQAVLRVGRSRKSDVVLHSSIVSRLHLELWNHGQYWELINFGANGTYVDGQSINQMSIHDEVTVRLGMAGPLITIQVEPGSTVNTLGSIERSSNPFSSKFSDPLSSPTRPRFHH